MLCAHFRRACGPWNPITWCWGPLGIVFISPQCHLESTVTLQDANLDRHRGQRDFSWITIRHSRLQSVGLLPSRVFGFDFQQLWLVKMSRDLCVVQLTSLLFLPEWHPTCFVSLRKKESVRMFRFLGKLQHFFNEELGWKLPVGCLETDPTPDWLILIERLVERICNLWRSCDADCGASFNGYQVQWRFSAASPNKFAWIPCKCHRRRYADPVKWMEMFLEVRMDRIQINPNGVGILILLPLWFLFALQPPFFLRKVGFWFSKICDNQLFMSFCLLVWWC